MGDISTPKHIGFRALRVINEDWIVPGSRFPSHAHQDMEILTYVLSGTALHTDNLGHRSLIRSGQLQRMTAGTGIIHSEDNPSSDEKLHLLQIWIEPEELGLLPSYEQKDIPLAPGQLQVIGSRQGGEHADTLHQDATLYTGRLEAGDRIEYQLKPGRYGWLQVVRGIVLLNGGKLRQGDGVALVREPDLTLETDFGSEVLLFDLA
ncbi:MAG: pirin family protein [Thermostichus sp. DG02_5_bins_236]